MDYITLDIVNCSLVGLFIFFFALSGLFFYIRRKDREHIWHVVFERRPMDARFRRLVNQKMFKEEWREAIRARAWKDIAEGGR